MTDVYHNGEIEKINRLNLREQWKGSIGLESGPENTQWKFAKNLDHKAKEAFEELAIIFKTVLDNPNIPQEDKKVFNAALAVNVAIGHSGTQGTEHWKAPFANCKQGWISFPETLTKSNYENLAMHELVHVMLGNHRFLEQVKADSESKPSIKEFDANWKAHGYDASSNLDGKSDNYIDPKSKDYPNAHGGYGLTWNESWELKRQVYGEYSHDWEYYAVWASNHVLSKLIQSDQLKEDTYDDVNNQSVSNIKNALLEVQKSQRIHANAEQGDYYQSVKNALKELNPDARNYVEDVIATRLNNEQLVQQSHELS